MADLTLNDFDGAKLPLTHSQCRIRFLYRRNLIPSTRTPFHKTGRMRIRVNLFEKTGLSHLRILMMMGWLIIILNGSKLAIAQWVSHGPPGVVNAIAIDPKTPATLYAGTFDGAIFKSSDGGGRWSASGLTNNEIWTLVLDPQTPTTLYAGTSGGVYKSTDSGASYTAINNGLTSTIVLALAVDPQTPTTVYAGTGYGGLFKSSNGGESWSAANTGLTNPYVDALAIDPQRVSTLYAGTFDGGVFKSNDGGGSWTAINSGLRSSNVLALAVDPQAPATLYAGISGGGVFKSSNGGESWTAINNGLTINDVRALAIDPQTPTSLYAGTNGNGLFKSTDGGGSWSAIDSGLRNLNVPALAIDPQNPSRTYAGTSGGVFVSSQTTCTYSISPIASSYSSSGITSDQVTVTATGCGWTAASDDPWITITSGSSGSANGVVTFSVAPNTSPASRAGTMTVAGETFTVTQAGVSSAFSIGTISPNIGPTQWWDFNHDQWRRLSSGRLGLS